MTPHPHEPLFADDCPYCAYRFDALSPEVVGTLQHASALRHHDAGAILFRAGDAPRMVWVITAGAVTLTGSEGVVRIATSGELLALGATLLNRPHAVTAVCASTSLVTCAPRGLLLQALTEHPAAGERLAAYARADAHRNDRDFPPALQDAASALAGVVLDMAAVYGGASNGGATFEIPFEDIVHTLHSPEASLAGAMDELERRGIIRVRAPFMTIIDAAALRRLRGAGRLPALVHS